MAYAEITVGAVWMLLGSVMVWSGLFDRRLPLAGTLTRALEAPLLMVSGVFWIVRFCLRLAFGGPGRAKASR